MTEDILKDKKKTEKKAIIAKDTEKRKKGFNWDNLFEISIKSSPADLFRI
ncbi:hypothetical protein RhiirA4_482934 [Rhizophagus irregularis]|uniref:Uncharacterized protein n=1 Tax=Rhizophagus irregularis TaxID=588596 RepID=A0A2I1HLV1_9GLOM|nr:hypothetical protein RhiirA4_482934 [Rhizophagus irregularis]